MKTISANEHTVLPLGRCGENLTRQIVFDISNWESLYGVGTVELIYQRPTDERPYIMKITREGSQVHWEITAWHTAVEDGYGKCELRYYVGDVLKKSKTWSIRVDPALDAPIEPIPPSPEQGWVDQVLSAAGKAENTLTLAEGFANKSETASGQATDAAAKAETAAVRAETAADRSEQNNTPPYQIGNGLKLSNNTLEVDTAQDFNGNNARPASAALVQTTAKIVETLSDSALLKSQIAQETGASVEKVMSQKAVTDAVNHYAIPDYWEEHLRDKINAIKELQRAGGKNSFSFIVIADPHYAQNLGKISPHLAKKILNECNIRYVLGLGDFQNRSAWATKKEAVAEWDGIQQMFAPIAENLLAAQGNHDGSWGITSNNTLYPYNFTPEELFTLLFAPTYQHHNAITDESGTAYYVDDKALKIRYILLNSTCNDYNEDEFGHAKYNNMSTFRFTQAQFDFLISKALASIPDDTWHVVIAGHAPLWPDEVKDSDILKGVLSAYKSKSSYAGSYTGTALGEKAYTNLFEADTAKGYVSDAYFSSSSVEPVSKTGNIVTNYIPLKHGQTIHIKGISTSVNGGSGYCRMTLYDENKSFLTKVQLPTNSAAHFLTADYDENVAVYAAFFTDSGLVGSYGNAAYIRLSGELSGTIDDVIITVDEKIAATAHGYDYVSVDVDFSNAKGKLIGYFSGHSHLDMAQTFNGICTITSRCDGANENDSTLLSERIKGTITEQSFDVFTVNTKTQTIWGTKIGAGSDRTITYE